MQCTFNGERWGLECKAFYSFDRDKQCAKIVEGADQIERSPVDFGMVAVNVSNIFPHEALFDATMNAKTSDEVVAFANQVQRQWIQRFQPLLRDDSPLLRGRKTRAVFFVCPMTVNVKRVPALYCSVTPLLFRRIEHHSDNPFGMSFTRAAETAMSFLPPEALLVPAS